MMFEQFLADLIVACATMHKHDVDRCIERGIGAYEQHTPPGEESALCCPPGSFPNNCQVIFYDDPPVVNQ